MKPDHIVDFQVKGRELVLATFPWCLLMRQSEGIDTVEAELDTAIFLRLTCNEAIGKAELYTNDSKLAEVVGAPDHIILEDELDPKVWSDFQGWMSVALDLYSQIRNTILLLVPITTHGTNQVTSIFLKPHEQKLSTDGGTWEPTSTTIVHSLLFPSPISPVNQSTKPIWNGGVREMEFKNPTHVRTKLAGEKK